MNAGNTGIIEELCAEDMVEHEEFPGLEQTRAGVKQWFDIMRAAFPDLHMRVEHMVGEGDLVIAHGYMSGTHQGSFMGLPPTHRKIEFPFADIVRFGEDGLAAEHWGVGDSGMMLQQLGVVPAGVPAAG